MMRRLGRQSFAASIINTDLYRRNVEACLLNMSRKLQQEMNLPTDLLELAADLEQKWELGVYRVLAERRVLLGKWETLLRVERTDGQLSHNWLSWGIVAVIPPEEFQSLCAELDAFEKSN